MYPIRLICVSNVNPKGTKAMKTLLLIALFALAPLAFASTPNLKADLLKDPAVRGAVAHAKRFSGAPTCDAPEIQVKDGRFEAWVSCNNPGDPKESERLGYGTESMGQIHVYGTYADGLLMLEKIEFNYAG